MLEYDTQKKCHKLHPFCQQRDIVAFCSKNNIVIQAYCPLIRGDFSNLTIQEISQTVCYFE